MATSISAKHLYREAMEQVHTYNSKLLLDRRLRMPYIDNQTGLAQQDCHLWVSRVQRCAPMRKGQIYSYPSRRWMVRKRPDFVGSSKEKKDKKAVSESVTTDDNNNNQEAVIENESKPDVVKTEETATVVEAPVPLATTYVDDFFDDDPFDSDLDSDEEFGTRKKKRKSARSSRSSKRNSNYSNSNSNNANNSMAFKFGVGDHKWKVGKVVGEDVSKPAVEEKKKFYDCQFCSKRYKNQQSLRYHYEHHNHNLTSTDSTTSTSTSSVVSTVVANPVVTSTTSSVASTSSDQPAASTPPQPASDQPLPNHVTGAKRKKGMPPSSFCDFCLGSANSTKKNAPTGELISCADCGRSGHPSCLQFNENLTDQVKKYKWQCIECKSCCICGTSDNDEQLLFCDDCDRGYHMYCLTPPIAEPPEGSWQCQLCEARVKGKDISKVPVLTQHMDIAYQSAIKVSAVTSIASSSTETVTTTVATTEASATPSTVEQSLKTTSSNEEETEAKSTPMEVEGGKPEVEESAAASTDTSTTVSEVAATVSSEVVTTST